MPQSVRIKDQHYEQRLFERRAIGAGLLMLLAIGAVIARLVWLQVVRYDYFVELSQGNRIKVEAIPPNRGLILDRNGVPLATNSPSFQLELTREQVPNVDDTLKALSEIGLIDAADIPADRQKRGPVGDSRLRERYTAQTQERHRSGNHAARPCAKSSNGADDRRHEDSSHHRDLVRRRAVSGENFTCETDGSASAMNWHRPSQVTPACCWSHFASSEAS
jgi:cell division protein FtsI/penicillin-binding protein 2